MPFDALPQIEVRPDLSEPSLAGLSWMLRHKEAWPEGFVWDYRNCASCAIGLSDKLWDFLARGSALYQMANVFRMGYLDTGAIFFDLAERLKVKRSAITPEDVADAIDAHLASQS